MVSHVHDSTMKKAFQEFQQRLVGINGKPYVVSDTMEDAAWLKQNIAAQTLPNGFCALPVVSQKCPHANACLSCGNFKTDKRFLPQHQQQLAETEKLIEHAKANGWERVYEVNKTVQANLKTIISALEKTDGKSHCSRKEECRVE
jgi:integrase/recombinase XerD